MVTQCGANVSLTDMTEELEPAIGIPILGTDSMLSWWAPRQNGIDSALQGAGRSLRMLSRGWPRPRRAPPA